MNIKVLFLSSLCMVCVTHLSSQTDWEIEKDQDNILIETRVTDLTPIKEFRATTTVKAPINDVVRALTEVEKHPEWMTDIEYAERISETPEVLHYNVKTPFPMKDRYIVVEVKTMSSDSSWRLEMENTDVEPNAIDDQVHVPVVRGYWQFNKIDDNTTAVRYQFLSDPGLNMPDWLVNMFIVNNPYKTLKSLRKRLE